jgi:hypothetical protein
MMHLKVIAKPPLLLQLWAFAHNCLPRGQQYNCDDTVRELCARNDAAADRPLLVRQQGQKEGRHRHQVGAPAW